MAKQTFTTGQVLLASQLTSLQQTALGGGAASAKTASYTLVAADAGTTISMTSTSATTVTINSGLFAAGDTVFIQNLGTGNCTITAGTATVATAGSLILPQNDAGILYFVSASSSVFYDYIQAGAVSPLTTKGDVYTFSTSDARLAVGTNGQVLTADSAEATGLKFATPASGGMTLLSTTSMNTGTATVEVTGISQAHESLMIFILNPTFATGTAQLLLSAQSGASIMGAGVVMFNSGANVLVTAYAGTDFSTTGQQVSNTTARINSVWSIFNYASTTAFKSWSIFTGDDSRATTAGGVVATNTAISSIKVANTAGNLFNGGSIKIYGVK